MSYWIPTGGRTEPRVRGIKARKRRIARLNSESDIKRNVLHAQIKALGPVIFRNFRKHEPTAVDRMTAMMALIASGGFRKRKKKAEGRTKIRGIKV